MSTVLYQFKEKFKINKITRKLTREENFERYFRFLDGGNLSSGLEILSEETKLNYILDSLDISHWLWRRG